MQDAPANLRLGVDTSDIAALFNKERAEDEPLSVVPLNRESPVTQLVSEAFDLAHDVLTRPCWAAAIRVAVMDSILDRAGFPRQTKVETDGGRAAPPTVLIPGIEKLSIEQLVALAQGAAQGMGERAVPTLIEVEATDVANKR